LDRVNAKLGLEILPTILPIHDPDDLAKLSEIFGGLPWGKIAYAMSADVWRAVLNHPEGWEIFDEYLEAFAQTLDYMRGDRDELPDVILADDDLAREFLNRRRVIELELEKKGMLE